MLVIQTIAYSVLEVNVFLPPSASLLTLVVPIKVQPAKPAISSAVPPS